MAKNFPYFKFIATEWLTGDIVFEDYELQGIFINVCALYWQRNGEVSIADLQKRMKTDRLAELTDRFISVNDGFISVNFLDEQLVDAGHISKVNSDNGSKGGRPRKSESPINIEEKTDRLATVKRTESEIKQRKEEGKEIKEKESIADKPPTPKPQFIKPTLNEVAAYFEEKKVAGAATEAERFVDFYTSNGWKVGKNSMKDWEAACRNWIKNKNKFSGTQQPTGQSLRTDAEIAEEKKRNFLARL